ncbi:MAG: hypothetical protein GF384_02805 [Elusimicrobia bacterium]|nr:hypothetical protein [Elusimicrobiota bacterium]MBD3411883.1 hypothetical protein [Elusimicrobiota bacterium]
MSNTNKNRLRSFLSPFAAIIISAAITVGQESEISEQAHTLSLEEFINQSVINDTVFEEILINELTLQYTKTLGLPAADILLDIKGSYRFNTDQDIEDPEGSISLTKLFPRFGTDLSATYAASVTSADTADSEMEFTISQPIAKNAFGRTYRLDEAIIGIENEIASFQIVEAYEDYLASIIKIYYNWYEAYTSMQTAESSYRENLKLLKNIEERRTNNIALRVDVNKITLQVLAKKEDLIALTNQYHEELNLVKEAIRYQGYEAIKPVNPTLYRSVTIDFDGDFQKFFEQSRTARILNLIESKTNHEVDKYANNLFPSLNLLFTHQIDGDDYDVNSPEKEYHAGIEIELPVPSSVERAQYRTALIENRKSVLNRANTYSRLSTQLRNLYENIQTEKQLISIAEEKLMLGEEILEDETENYSYGRVTLNDLIQEINKHDQNRFNKILSELRYKTLVLEWQRLTDQLITRDKIKTPIKPLP